MMTGNGDCKVQTTLLTIRVPPPGLPEVGERRSPAFSLDLSTDKLQPLGPSS